MLRALGVVVTCLFTGLGAYSKPILQPKNRFVYSNSSTGFSYSDDSSALKRYFSDTSNYNNLYSQESIIMFGTFYEEGTFLDEVIANYRISAIDEFFDTVENQFYEGIMNGVDFAIFEIVHYNYHNSQPSVLDYVRFYCVGDHAFNCMVNFEDIIYFTLNSNYQKRYLTFGSPLVNDTFNFSFNDYSTNFSRYEVTNTETNITTLFTTTYTTTYPFSLGGSFGVANFNNTDMYFYPFVVYVHFNANLISDFTTIYQDYTFIFNAQYYNNGAYNDGYNSGYQTGYNTGLTQGYNNGYTDASNLTHQYTFLNLFGAIADTPIMILRSLLGFDVFGVSAMAIFMTMITGCIALFILRKIL